jgi:YggT family protein
MSTFLSVARTVVFAAFVAAAVLATVSWLLRTHRVSPFSGLGGFLRRASDPVMRPVEAGVVRIGGHPRQAGFWLLIGTAVVGILLLWVLQWTADVIQDLRVAAGGGARGMAAFVVGFAYRIVIIAIVVRVVAGWFGAGRYNKWIRPAYVLTDWIVEPLRRVVPPLGAFDVTPLVAWVVLWLLQWFILVVLL